MSGTAACYPKVRTGAGRAPMAPDPVRWQRAHHALIAAPSRDEILSRWGLTRAEAEAGRYGLDGGALAIPHYDPSGLTLLGVKLRKLAATHEDPNRFCWADPGKAPPLYTPPGSLDGEEVWLAEGPLKAAGFSRILGRPVAALANGARVGIPVEGRALLVGNRVFYVGDPDAEGRLVPGLLARQLRGVAAELRAIAFPPDGPGDINDALVSVASQDGDTLAAPREQVLGAMAQARDLFGEAPAPAEDAAHAGGNPQTGKPSQAQRLVELAQGAELFCTPDGETGFATFEVNGHRETWAIRSRGFRRWLTSRFYREEGRPPSAQPMADALAALEARAQFGESPRREVFVRIAHTANAIYVDLADEAWSAVEVTAAGWRLVSDPPVRFRRPRGMLPLPVPTRGGSLAPLRSFLNIGDGPEGDDDWALTIGFLLGAFSRGPYPVYVAHGDQGSAKTTRQRILRSFLDPNVSPMRGEPRELRDVMVAAANGWSLCWDNLSHLPAWLSDAICRLSTGGGFSTRELYTDAEECIFAAQRPVMLNGIEELAVRGDLLDRAIIVYLPAIPDDKRLREDDLWRCVNAIRPAALGAILDAVACGLRSIDAVCLPSLPRMADFVTWVEACAPALGWAPGAFLAACRENRGRSHDLELEAAPVAVPLLDLLPADEELVITAKDLLARLNGQADEATRHQRGWPGSPRALTNAIRRLTSVLAARGIEVDFRREAGGNRRRIIALRKGTHSSVPTVPTVPRGGDATPPQGDDRWGRNEVTPGGTGDSRDGRDASAPAFSGARDEGELL